MSHTPGGPRSKPAPAQSRNNAPRRATASRHRFLAIQTLTLLVLCGLGASHFRAARTTRRIPSFHSTPRVIPSHANLPLAISDQQLARVLYKLRPRLNHAQPKINYVDHALRMWGDTITFHESDCLDGPEMRQLLVSHDDFTKRWGAKERPLLIQDKYGPRWRTQQGKATISHVDHTLATLAEIGISLDDPVVTANGPSSMRELLESAVKRFQLNQAECEWTVLACALYAKNLDGWVTSEGQALDLDLIALRLIREKPNEGVCYGNHRLFTLAMLLRIDEQTGWFTPRGRAAVTHHLRAMTARLVHSQSPEGYWDSNWPDLTEAPDARQEPTARRLLATGHALEWWAMAPATLQPPRETIVRAAQWLVREIDQLEEKDVVANYTFLTHVGRALALWRGGNVDALYQRCYSLRNVPGRPQQTTKTASHDEQALAPPDPEKATGDSDPVNAAPRPIDASAPGQPRTTAEEGEDG